MSEAETKALLAKYFQKAKSHFSQCTVELIYTMFDKLFILIFVTNYPISWQLLMGVIFSYPLIGQFDIIRQPKRLTFYHMLGILLLYNNFHRWSCQAIHTNHWEVECCTFILILSSNKTIRTLA